MANTLAHRGPDDVGVWVDETAGIVLGHRRLSILDLSPLGRQPMLSQCGRYVLVFNGEIYNYGTLRTQLVQAGSRFFGSSDTEVMLEAISQWGLRRAIQTFNGMFAFALWDKLERRLFLARDRFGEKPLYYAWFGRSFVFGSELKALRRCPEFDGEINRTALAAYFRLDYIPAPSTIYKAVKKVPAAGMIKINPCLPGCAPKFEHYWSAAAAIERGHTIPFNGNEEEATDQLDLLLRDAVRLRMHADVPLGAFLSGGIDSSTIVALMQEQSSSPVQTFTVDFPEKPSEAEYATRIAAHLGTDHHVLQVTSREALDIVPRLPSLYDEPFADSSQIPTFLISEFARRHVTVSLSGDGGDELFCGYNRYVWANTFENWITKLPIPVREGLGRALIMLSNPGSERSITAAAQLLPANIRPTNLQGLLCRIGKLVPLSFARELHLELVSRWADSTNLVQGAGSEFIFPDKCKSGSFARSLMFLDTVTYLPDDLLVKVDRASMAVSLEARVPLLDHRLFEFACRLPLHIGLNGKGRKRILRRVLARYVPRGLFERPKEGFSVPLRHWLLGPLRPWAETLLSEQALNSSSCLNPSPIRSKWKELVTGDGNWQEHIWSVLMFQAWFKYYADNG
jgi:asparagine synthase (glutamine-hydrolysing)